MIRDTGRTAMGAGVLARVDDDIIAEGGTRLEFESIAEAPMEYATLNDSRVPVAFEKSWTSRIGPFLTGAALGTAAHATYALVEQGNSIAIFSSDGLLGNLGAWVLSRSNPGVDPVEQFLRRADLLHDEGVSVDKFKDAGYTRLEDFWGITDGELEGSLGISQPAHRRRLVLQAERMKNVFEQNENLYQNAAATIVVLTILVTFVFAVALAVDQKFRKRIGVYVGITCAIGWYYVKTYLDKVAQKRERKRAERFMRTNRRSLTLSNSGASHSRVRNLRRAETSDAFADDDSAFEGSRHGSPGRGFDDKNAPEPVPPGLTGPLCDDTSPADVLSLREKWKSGVQFQKARRKLFNWRRSREEYPDYEAELLKLKLAVPQDLITDHTMAVCGDYDAMYRRFLSAQGGKAVKAEKMLRNTIEWRQNTDLVGKMRVWSSIPDDIKKKTYEGYQSGWYSSHTSLGCPVYIERTGKLHLAKVLKFVSADDIVDHHLRMMEWMMRVLMPEMEKRAFQERAERKELGERNGGQGSGEGSDEVSDDPSFDAYSSNPYPAPDKVINLLDMHGLSSRVLGRASMQIFKRVLNLDQSYFPEIMYRCYIVNCPAVFRIVWAAVKPLLDKRIQKKIFIYGPVKGKVMDEMVALFGGVERVPAFMGGTCQRDLYQCPPWGLTNMDDDTFVSWEKPIRPEAGGVTAS